MDKEIDRNEKLYRMLMTVYDVNGDPFWGVVQELAAIIHRNDDTFSTRGDKADAAFIEAIPEAQGLMQELLKRGLVYVTRRYGYPPPSYKEEILTKAEAEKIMCDVQSWMGPIKEGPLVTYYRFCSTVPGKSITRDSILLLK